MSESEPKPPKKRRVTLLALLAELRRLGVESYAVGRQAHPLDRKAMAYPFFATFVHQGRTLAARSDKSELEALLCAYHQLLEATSPVSIDDHGPTAEHRPAQHPPAGS